MTDESAPDGKGGITRRHLLKAAAGTPVALSIPAIAGGQEANAPGEEIWHVETDDFVRSSPTIVGATVFVGSSDHNVYALDADSGTEYWHFESFDGVTASPNVLDDTVYVGSFDDNLLAIDDTDGELDWNFETNGSIGASPTVSDGVAYVGSHDNHLVAVDAISGEFEWAFETGADVLAAPTVSEETIYVTSSDGNLYAVDTDGDERWRFETTGFLESSPTIADGVVYFGSYINDEGLYAVDVSTGEQQWHALDVGVSSSPTVHDGTVYVGAHDDRLYALDAANGETRWEFETDDWITRSSPTVAEGTVFVGSSDNNLYAVDTEGGTEQWQFETDGSIESSPTVVEGIVYVGSMDGTVYAVNAGVDGSSEDSRVRLGTLGHHHEFAGVEPGRPPGLIDEPITAGPIDLSEVELAANQAEPFELVEVTGIPEDVDVTKVFAEYQPADSGDPVRPEAEGLSALCVQPNEFITADERDGIYLFSPLFDEDGTELRLKITDGESYSAALSLTVDPLPPASEAEGAWDDLVDSMIDLIRNTTEAYEMTYPADLDGFLDNPETIDPKFTELLRTYDAIANPDNDDSFVNLPDDVEGMEELERILHHARAPEQFEGMANFVADGETLIGEAVEAMNSAQTQGMAGDTPQLGTLQTGGDIVMDPIFEIDGPAELAEKIQGLEEVRQRWDSGEYMEDVISDYNVDDQIERALELIALETTSELTKKRANQANRAISRLLFAANAGLSIAILQWAFQPCCITETRIEDPSGETFELEFEDGDEPQLTINDVRADAKSDESLWEDLYDRVMDSVEGAVPTIPTNGIVSEFLEWANDEGLENIEWGVSEAFEAANLNGRNAYTEWTDIDMMDGLPNVWLDHEITSTGGGPVIWEFAGGIQPVIEYRLDPETFFDDERAVNHLKIEPAPEEFPPGFEGDEMLLRATVIEVVPSRPITRVRGGEPEDLGFTINHSTLQEDPPYTEPVELEPGHGSIEDVEVVGEGEVRVTYLPPSSVPDDFEERVILTADAPNGVRSPVNDPPEREGTAFLRGRDHLVLSRVGCMESGESAPILAQVLPEDATLSWEADAGQLDVSADTHRAVFTAGDTTGNIGVVVTVEGSDRVATTTVPVRGRCPCAAEIYSGIGNIEVEDTDPLVNKVNMYITPPRTDVGTGYVFANGPTQPLPSAGFSSEAGALNITFQGRGAWVPEAWQEDVWIDWEDFWSPSIHFAHPAIRDDGETITYLSGMIRPRVVQFASEGTVDPVNDISDIDPETAVVIDHGTHFEHLASGMKWSKCVDEGVDICEYTTGEGDIGMNELRNVIRDWRSGETTMQTLREAGTAFQNGEPVDGC